MVLTLISLLKSQNVKHKTPGETVMFKSIPAAIIILFSLEIAQAQPPDTLRIASYNLLNFPSEDGGIRIPHFVRVIHAIKPDILVVQELQSESGQSIFLSQVMNTGLARYQAAPFTSIPNILNSGFFYNQDKVTLLGVNLIRSSPRDIMEYVAFAGGQEFSIFSVHFKAGSEDLDRISRARETTTLRNYLNSMTAGSNFMVAGDYNVTSSNSSEFQILIESQTDNDGRLFDPINQLGDWSNNNFFSNVHTQSTRTTTFGEGIPGGLDDRFDFMLVSSALLAEGGMDYLQGSYRAFGNDGNHFNEAINARFNNAVPDSIADALHSASDHLPVRADFLVGMGGATSVANEARVPQGFTLFENYPNPFNPGTAISFRLEKASHVRLEIFSTAGERIAVVRDKVEAAGTHTVWFDASQHSSGIYIYRLAVAGEGSISKKMLLIK